jgi:hypothetical protein
MQKGFVLSERLQTLSDKINSSSGLSACKNMQRVGGLLGVNQFLHDTVRYSDQNSDIVKSRMSSNNSIVLKDWTRFDRGLSNVADSVTITDYLLLDDNYANTYNEVVLNDKFEACVQDWIDRVKSLN